MKENIQKIEAESANDVWVMNVSEGPVTCHNGYKRKTYLISMFDLRSRFIFLAEYRYLLGKGRRNQLIERMLKQYGIPDYLVCKENYASDLEFLTHDLRIGLIHERELERRERMVCQRIAEHLNQMQKTLPEYSSMEQNSKAASECKDKWNHYQNRRENNPKSCFLRDISKRAFLDKEALFESFLWRITRTVKTDGMVWVCGNIYETSEIFCGEKLVFRIDLRTGSELYLYDEEKNRMLLQCPLKKR